MSLGEWLSITTSADTYLREIEVQAEEFSQMPEDEREQLMLIYRSKGLTDEEAAILADRLISKREPVLKAETGKEMVLDAGQFGSTAIVAAGSSFALFASGAIFPVMPFFFVSGAEAVAISIGLSAVVLFLIGAGTTLFTGRSLMFSGMRQL
jgi:VIT1/CCC1 family predicted Fe2+/Mn2+ transporter